MAVTFSDSTGGAWGIWCDNSSTSATSSSSVWSVWVGDNTTTCASVTTNTTWGNWVTSSGSSTVIRSTYTPKPESEEERQVRLERERIQREEWQRKEDERKAKEAEANKKADELLKSLLTPEQVKQLDEMACFIVTTPQGNTYRIKRGWSGNVEKLDQNQRPVERLCAHPSEYVPYGDNMAAQLLMLQTEEERFLKVANRTRLTPVAN